MPWDIPDKPRDEDRRIETRDDIVSFCHSLLEVDKFKDYGPMGLQFKGNPRVERIACGVSVSQDLIERALDWNADMLVVHHGLFWNNEPRQLDERMKTRLRLLEEANMSLLAYHLALDAHPTVGNNVLALDDFEGSLRRFGDIGWGKKLDRPFKRDDLSWFYPNTTQYRNGPTQIRKVAAIVGGAPHYIHDAVRDGYDLFITGEAAEPTQALAKELGINFVALGHYNSEKIGVDALTREVRKRFNVTTRFIDIPNEV
jgi:dinuclear metal center YbgI/SA1388 family protein